ncbi:transmembrane protein 272-like [Bombina bombina]|uniref:transmembrane protein 272-like n=1 Tax=Bombina bombina TaxID=8345 RepID=UPI00235B1B88|nr:transmembrane protein 272-like [Bombina bombina]
MQHSRRSVLPPRRYQDEQNSSGTAKSNKQINGSYFTLTLWTFISIAMIVIGAISIEYCPIQPNIPIYLIVAGSTTLLGFLLLPLRLVSETLSYIIEGILGLFTFCWFITGSVWVFSVFSVSPRPCNLGAYNFAFGILIFQYAFLLLCILALICGCCFGYMVLFSNSTQTNTEQTQGQNVFTIQNTV